MKKYVCSSPCLKSYDKSGSLQKHQNACSVFQDLKRNRKRPLSTVDFVDERTEKRKKVLAVLEDDEIVAQRQAEDAGQCLPVAARADEEEEMQFKPGTSAFDFDEPQAGGSTPPPAPGNQSGAAHSRITIRLPARYRDIYPEPHAPAEILPPPRNLPNVFLIVRDKLTTAVNSFGLFREYLHRPSYDPEALVENKDLATPRQTGLPAAPSSAAPSSASNPTPAPSTTYWPFANASIHRLMSWMNNGNTQKTAGELDALVQNVLKAPDFNLADLPSNFRTETENRRMDKALDSSDDPFIKSFHEATITIDVPSGVKGQPPRKYSVPGLYYRRIIDTLRGAFTGPFAPHLHFSPFKSFHKSDSHPDGQTRVHGEVYTSDAFIAEHDYVQTHAPVPPEDSACKREKIIAALMYLSDATHLANFGVAKAWPIYQMLGNMSKYIRSQLNSGVVEHIAYIPTLPDAFGDWVSEFHPKWKTQKKDIMTHCRRELMHAVWQFLLSDPEFLHAYKYGIVILCLDGIERRVYPRLFTYSADYPEKVLLATIRDKGLCPCPRCFVPKSKLDLMGQRRDDRTRWQRARFYLFGRVETARRMIYSLARAIGGLDLLKESSSVPTNNAFIQQLGKAFNPFRMLVVDLLHEFELGVWKTLFTHLIRILYAVQGTSGTIVDELDRRFRLIPTFGSTIRRFATNASQMKKLAARDFEDILQCSIPVFEGLLPEPFNTTLLTLLYRMAEWHALAKLRMHTDETLSLLESTTTTIGRLMRDFRDNVCSQFSTFELPREQEARQRRRTQTEHDHGGAPADSSTSARKPRTLNLMTPKFHALGDYVRSIRLFGTTDSYSTQLGELAHRVVKKMYGMTNKKNAMKQIAKRQGRRNLFRRTEEAKDSESASLEAHHFISKSRNRPINLFTFTRKPEDNDLDPAKKNFIPKLQDHFLGRLLGRQFDGDTHEEFSDDDRNSVRVMNHRIYRQQLLRVNYTTYDVRRDYDTISPLIRPFVMVKNPEALENHAAHPYWYAQVLGIFHAQVMRVMQNGTAERAHHMEFLWVRWLGDEPGYRSGHRNARLPKVGYVPDTDDYAFGFLDPAVVIRGAHLIPAFAVGTTPDLLSFAGETEARMWRNTPAEVGYDWENFYVDIFLDRDTFMRHLGGGIGHLDNSPGLDGAPMDEDEDADADADASECEPVPSDEVPTTGQRGRAPTFNDEDEDEDEDIIIIDDDDDDEDSNDEEDGDGDDDEEGLEPDEDEDEEGGDEEDSGYADL